MALDFPSTPSVGDHYPLPPAPPRWVWNGVSWVSAPISTGLYLPLTGGTLSGPGNLTVRGLTHLDDDATVDGDVTITGGVTADHVTTTGTSLDVAGSATIGGTLTVDGATEFNSTVEIGGEPVATEDWTMQQVAAGGLWQGTWDAENNIPDLTQAAVQLDGYTWAVVLTDPTASFTIPATPVIPGLNGQVVWTGYHVIWSTSASEFQIVPGGGMSMTQAQALFLAKTGGTLAGPGNLTVDGTLTVQGHATFPVTAYFGSGGAQINGSNLTITNGGIDVTTGSISVTNGGMSINGVPVLSAFSVAPLPTVIGGLQVTGYADISGTFFQAQTNGIYLTTTADAMSLNSAYGIYLNGPAYFNDNIVVTGSGTTSPTAKGNVTIASTNLVNGNLTLTGTQGGNINANNITARAYAQANYMYAPGASFNNLDANGQVFLAGCCFYVDTNRNITYYGGDATGPPQNYFTFNGNRALRLWGTYMKYLGSQAGIDAITVSSPFYLNTNGHGLSVDGPVSAPSDARLKTDVKDYEAGLDQLLQLTPIRFRYNDRGRVPETGRVHIGLAAEQAQEVMPELVSKVRGKLGYDEDETDILHVDQLGLQYAMINALKEITKRIEALEEKLK